MVPNWSESAELRPSALLSNAARSTEFGTPRGPHRSLRGLEAQKRGRSPPAPDLTFTELS